ncbi:MAG: glycosyltransferase family A protein, partial [Pseudonocardia sediminis]
MVTSRGAGRAWSAAVDVGAVLAVAATAHQVVNLRALRTPSPRPPDVGEPVSVLVPARDEAHRIGPTIRSLLAQSGVADLEILVLDDGSTDGTADVVRAAAAGDDRVRVHRGTPPPGGWLGKPHACAQLAALARGRVLVLVDADVVLAPHAVAAAVALLRAPDRPLDLLCPWPRQLADGVAPRLLQPLQVWSWTSLLPLRRAERSHRPSFAAANGQFLLVDAAALGRAGGFGAVAGEVLDDIGLARAVMASGG